MIESSLRRPQANSLMARAIPPSGHTRSKLTLSVPTGTRGHFAGRLALLTTSDHRSKCMARSLPELALRVHDDPKSKIPGIPRGSKSRGQKCAFGERGSAPGRTEFRRTWRGLLHGQYLDGCLHPSPTTNFHVGVQKIVSPILYSSLPWRNPQKVRGLSEGRHSRTPRPQRQKQ